MSLPIFIDRNKVYDTDPSIPGERADWLDVCHGQRGKRFVWIHYSAGRNPSRWTWAPNLRPWQVTVQGRHYSEYKLGRSKTLQGALKIARIVAKEFES